MKHIAIAILLVCSLPASAAKPPKVDVVALAREGGELMDAKKYDEAIAKYAEALAADVKKNVKVSRELDRARKLLEVDLAAHPMHANEHYALARLFALQRFRVPAILEYLRFLVIEPDTERGRSSASTAVAMLRGTVVTQGANAKVAIDPRPRIEEGDFGTTETMLALASASQLLPENKGKKDVEKLVDQIEMIIETLTESQERESDFTSQTNLPFFAGLRDNILIEPFVYVAFSSLALPGTKEWIAKNPAKVDAYRKWAEAPPPPAQ